MYSKFDPFSFVSMSNSEYLFIEKGPSEPIEYDDFRLEFSDENQITVATNDCKIQQQQDKEEEEEEEEEKEHGVSSTDGSVNKEVEEDEECISYIKGDDSFLKKELKIQSLGECEVDENDDGFQTPTSLEHKIPVIQQCPPAPKKPKSVLSSKKRKASSNINLVRIDLSKEMEMLFPIPPALLVDLGCKIKKAKGSNTK